MLPNYTVSFDPYRLGGGGGGGQKSVSRKFPTPGLAVILQYENLQYLKISLILSWTEFGSN